MRVKARTSRVRPSLRRRPDRQGEASRSRDGGRETRDPAAPLSWRGPGAWGSAQFDGLESKDTHAGLRGRQKGNQAVDRQKFLFPIS